MNPLPESRMSILKTGLLLLLVTLLAACGGRGDVQDEEAMSAEEFQRQQESVRRVEELNEELLLMSVESGGDSSIYRIGPEDRLEVRVFGVEDLGSEVRVAGDGTVQLPLVGEVEVSGLSVAEAEDVIAKAYADGYIRNPQVTVSVSEYRSQQFTLIGAVKQPRVYSTQRKTSLVEALAMGGGLDSTAGGTVYLTDRVRDPESGEMGTRSLLVPLEELMENPAELNVVLGESALINVPRTGSIFVEGAVSRPGVYNQRADTTILKAIAMAGGMEFEANKSRIKVVRRKGDEEAWEERYYSLDELRQGPEHDQVLADGDVVVVETSGFRQGLSTTARLLSPLAILGWRPL